MNESVKLWGRLLADWEKLDNDDPPTWRKDCGFFVAFITQEERGFTFELHGGDDEVLREVNLGATNLQDAGRESDDIISAFVQTGAGVLARNEIRIIHAYHAPTGIHGVATDGKLYRFDGTTWTAVPMTRAA